MKEKIAGRIIQMAEKAAYKSVGKSFDIGIYEVKPPEELLEKKRTEKNESIMQWDSQLV